MTNFFKDENVSLHSKKSVLRLHVESDSISFRVNLIPNPNIIFKSKLTWKTGISKIRYQEIEHKDYLFGATGFELKTPRPGADTIVMQLTTQKSDIFFNGRILP